MLYRSAQAEIIDLLAYFPAVGIIGPRQVGKTTLAKQIMQVVESDTLYLDLENEIDIARLSNPTLFLQSYQNVCVVIDEVQRLPLLFPMLRSLIDVHRVPGRFILLGSASPNLIRDSSESLAGRIAYQELYPLSLQELPGMNTFEHWLRGGFPDSLLAPTDKLSFTWRRNFVRIYVERDLPALGLETNAINIRNFWQMLASFHGNLWNAQNFSRSLGVSAPTVNRYLDFMEQAFLIRRLPPWSRNSKKRLVKSPKIYVRDSGLLHLLNGLSTLPELQGSFAIGASWEGYGIEQTLALLQDKAEAYFYRTQQGTEADLVIAKGNQLLIAIEIKYTISPKLSKGFVIATEDLATLHNVIITPGSARFPLKENIEVCGIETWISTMLPDLISRYL